MNATNEHYKKKLEKKIWLIKREKKILPIREIRNPKSKANLPPIT